MNSKAMLIPFLAAAFVAFVTGSGEKAEEPLKFTVEAQETLALDSLTKEAGFYTVIVTHGENGQRELGWFDSHAKLRGLKEATNFRHYKSTSPAFKARLANAYGNDYPIICVQDETGAMRAQINGTQLKTIASADELAKELDLAATRLRPARKVEAVLGGFFSPRKSKPEVARVPVEAVVGAGNCQNNACQVEGNQPLFRPCPDGVCPAPNATNNSGILDGITDKISKEIDAKIDAQVDRLLGKAGSAAKQTLPWVILGAVAVYFIFFKGKN